MFFNSGDDCLPYVCCLCGEPGQPKTGLCSSCASSVASEAPPYLGYMFTQPSAPPARKTFDIGVFEDPNSLFNISARAVADLLSYNLFKR